MSEATATVVVGPLMRARVRNAILTAQAKGWDVRLVEGSGWLERPMFIKGPERDVRVVYDALMEHASE